MKPSDRPDSAETDALRPPAAPSRPLDILLVDVEPATADLVALWLADEGWALSRHPEGERPVALVLIEIAFPRPGDRQRLVALAEVWPGAAIVVLSPTFLGDVPARGAVARQLGAAAVLATPLARERLLAVVRGLLGPAA